MATGLFFSFIFFIVAIRLPGAELMWVLFVLGLAVVVGFGLLAERWWSGRHAQRELRALLLEPVDAMGRYRLCCVHTRALLVEQMLYDTGQDEHVRDVHLFMARCDARLGEFQQQRQPRSTAPASPRPAVRPREP